MEKKTGLKRKWKENSQGGKTENRRTLGQNVNANRPQKRVKQDGRMVEGRNKEERTGIKQNSGGSKERFQKDFGKKGGKVPSKFQKPGPKVHPKKKWKSDQKSKQKGERPGDAKKPKLEEMKKKERKHVRKQFENKSNFEISQKAKTTWELIRRHNVSQEVKNKHISDLFELLQGRIMELMKAHDTVRVIQCCVQFGTADQRAKIFEEVKEHIVELSKSKYAKFYVLKMFRYGTKEQRQFMTRAFHGKVCQLIRHTEAAEVVEEAYNNHANAQQRSALMEEFYGGRFAVFKNTEGAHSLEDILKEDPAKKEIIMGHMLKTLTPLLDKSVVKHTMVHKAIYDFLVHAPDRMRAEFIEALREVVVQILHTLDGARAAMMCFWHGTTKDRKMMIKSFKTFIGKICKEEFGHRVLLALFDSVDDTKIVSKVIIEEMMKSAYELATDQYGRKVLLYLLVPRDPSHFSSALVTQLKKGDHNSTSKKEPSVRRKELLDAASPALLKLLISHTKEMAYSNSNSQLALAILMNAQGDKTPVYTMLATLAAEELVPQLINDKEKMEEMHIVEHPSGHLMLKRLLAHEKKETEQGEVSSSLSQCLMAELSDENIRSWVKINRGAFVLVSLVECGNMAARERIRSALEASSKSLAKFTSSGAKVLREKLSL